jgi:hypothetical protein
MAMGSRRILRFAVAAAALLFATSVAISAQTSTHRGRKYKSPPPTSRIEVSVMRSEDGHPVENAAVIFHLVGDKGNMELKTNDEGKAMIDVLPTGSKVLLQVFAKGYQTYGGEYDIDKANMGLEIKLNRPGHQYSIYDNHSQAADGKTPAKDAAPKDADKNASDASAKQPEAKPETNQPKPE